MKTCNKCNVEKLLELFQFDKSKGKHSLSCKACRNAVQKGKRETNRDEYNAKNSEWRHRTMERQQFTRRRWREENIEKVQESERSRYQSLKKPERAYQEEHIQMLSDDQHLCYFLAKLNRQNTPINCPF